MVMNKSKEDFKYNLGEAMGGCDYVTSHTTPDFKLLPEIYLQQGIIFSLQGKEARAAGEFVKAIEGNPKLDRAYINLARFYKRNKDTKNALEIITKGVMINPDSKALKRMYKELGGSLPLPVSTEAASTLAIDPKSPPAVENTIIMPPLEQKKEQHMGVKAEAKKNAVQLPTEQQQAPGSRANPWCRFCPDTPVKADPSPSNP
jgi:tetratricopeptide (TPR) repeat protein